MRDKYILKLFIAFLKQKGAYDDYLYELSKGESFRNYYCKKWLHPVDFITYEIKHNRPSELIDNAFDWEKSTTLSQASWWELSDEWEDLIYDKFK